MNKNENSPLSSYTSEQFDQSLEDSAYFGRMTDPTTASRIEGPCGDDIEFYLIIKDDIIEEIKFFTEKGCCNTKIAGKAVAIRAKNKCILDSLKINPGSIIEEESGLDEGGKHCSILAVTALYRAIALHFLNAQ
ncbi:MAG: iron-sulfur cluster assembly scaffold protein [Oligoflexia bacterium]|nr:iron-sulfur cluster assembly scaffold protein [Oligoflexia bacterium]